MCGIAGFVGKGTIDDLEKMTTRLSHRGPDDKGVFCENGVGLGHRRLSIIDLTAGGHQPMFSPDKKVGIVFNGEIYNFKELKENLIKEGVSFVSHSDTEVIIAMYQKLGLECFREMNGMFALAIYDFEKKTLVLARDRMGKKPLYWSEFNGTLVFASELKGILEHPLCAKEIDPVSLELYLSLDYVPTPRSIFKNIYKLEAGSYLTYQNKKIDKKTFWKLDFTETRVTFDEALLKLDNKIEESVKKRLVSDVPLGIFLSGGLDSSTIAYYAKKFAKGDLHTFSVGFSEESFDETKYSEQVSKYLNTKHHHTTLSQKDCLNLIPNIAEILDEPMADASIIPTYLLSKFTKENVTVALGGDGGDELFAGYPTFRADKFFTFYKILPSFIRTIISKVVNMIPVSETNFSFGFKMKKFVEGIDSDIYKTHQNWLGTFNEGSISMLLKAPSTKPLNTWISSVTAQIGSNKTKNSLLGMYMKTYMMDEVMVKVDRASMKASLETRSPLLDFELVDYVNTLPYSMKQHGFTGKYILKKLMQGKLPDNIIWRSKKGFGIPLSKWLKEDLKGFVSENLNKEAIETVGLFNWESVESILQDHFAGREDNRKKIWNLLVFILWWKKWAK